MSDGTSEWVSPQRENLLPAMEDRVAHLSDEDQLDFQKHLKDVSYACFELQKLVSCGWCRGVLHKAEIFCLSLTIFLCASGRPDRDQCIPRVGLTDRPTFALRDLEDLLDQERYTPYQLLFFSRHLEQCVSQVERFKTLWKVDYVLETAMEFCFVIMRDLSEEIAGIRALRPSVWGIEEF